MMDRIRMAAVVTIVALSACADPVGLQAPSGFTAIVEGNLQHAYSEKGSFQLRPAKVHGPRFTLHSAGTGPSTNQGFAFLTPEAPSPGKMPIGDLGGDIAHATYWYDEGGMRNLFRANSGMLRVTESTARRVVGEFELEATLLYVCEVTPGFPASLLICNPAEEETSLKIKGAFDAGPTGGLSPSLHPDPG